MRLWNYRSRRWQSGCGAAGTAGRFAVGWSRSSESRGWPSLLPSAIQDSRRNASMALLLPEAFAPIRKVSGASFSVASR